MADNERSLSTENLRDDDMICDFPHYFKSYVKNHQIFCQRRYSICVFWSGEDDPRDLPPPPPPPFSGNLQNRTEIINGTLIAPPIPEFMERIKSCFNHILFFWEFHQYLLQFWKVIEIGGKRLLTTRHQPFGFNKIDDGLCSYRLMSLDYDEFDVDGVSEEHLGLPGRVFRHQQLESTPNVQYYSCNEYPQRDRAVSCNIKRSLAVPLFESSTQCCIGVIEMVSTTKKIPSIQEIFGYKDILSHLQDHGLKSSDCMHSHDRKGMGKTLQEIKKMLKVVCSTYCLPLAQTWAFCRVCNVLFTNYRTYGRGTQKLDFLLACAKHCLRKGQGVVGRAVLSQNLVFCKDVTQFSITEYPLAHYARKYGLTGSFAICLRSSYIEDNVYMLEFFLPPNYTEGRDLRIALLPLLTTMKQHCKSFKVASGEELGEGLSIEVLDFSGDGELYSYQIPQTARTPNRMQNGEEMVWLDLSNQQLPEVDAIDTGNNVVNKTQVNNIVVTSSQQKLIINSSQRLQRKSRIPISLEEDGKLDSFKKPQTARSPNRMENGEEMVFLDLCDQQLPEVDAVDTENNVVSNTEQNNIVVTSVQQNCIINSSQRLQRKAGIPISLEDLQQRFGMKLKDAAESLDVSRSTVKRACREYNITWWPPRKRSKDNQLLCNNLVQGVVQEQILKSSQPPIFDPPHMQDMATASRTKPHFTAAQDTSIVTIKAKYGDDAIKFQLPVSSRMIEFQQQVAKRLNLQGGTYRVKYQDEDNDWILIACDEDLQNYICNSISQGRNNTVTMLIQPITNCPS